MPKFMFYCEQDFVIVFCIYLSTYLISTFAECFPQRISDATDTCIAEFL